ncbi:MAG: ParB/RepB/Spo0J family partition protein [Desulfurivibrio sp.]
MVKRNPLGKGLGALLPSRDEEEARSYFICAIDLIAPNPNQPRKQVDDEALEQLAESIREQGVLLPLVVRRLDGEDERYEIIAGERRWRAAGRAGLSRVPVLVKDVSPRDQLELALVENIQRQDLNPLEEAEAYLRLVQEYGLTQEDVAKRVGKDRSTVANALRINQLPAFAKDDLAQGRLTMGHARVLLALDSEEMMREVRDKVVEQGMSVRQTEELVRRKKSQRVTSQRGQAGARKKGNAIPDSYCRSITADLVRHFDTRVRVVQNGERGKLEIEYFSPDDLERVISLIVR